MWRLTIGRSLAQVTAHGEEPLTVRASPFIRSLNIRALLGDSCSRVPPYMLTTIASLKMPNPFASGRIGFSSERGLSMSLWKMSNG